MKGMRRRENSKSLRAKPLEELGKTVGRACLVYGEGIKDCDLAMGNPRCL